MLVAPKAGALHDCMGNVLLHSCLRRRPIERARWFNRPDPLQQPLAVAAELPKAVFIPGLQFGHFGHLLTETAAWLYPLLRNPSRPRQPRLLLLGGWSAEATKTLIEILRWNPNRVLCTHHLPGLMRVPEVWVPVPTMVNRDYVDRRHCHSVRLLLRRMEHIRKRDFTREAFDIRSSPHAPSAFLYLSRSRLSSTLRTIEREAELDLLLLELGWRVIHPETLSLRQQLRCLREARVIAGPLGSAFHLLFPLGPLPEGPLLLTLGYPDELTADGPGLNFGLQFQSQQMRNHHLPLLALKDAHLDPTQVPRHLPLRFVVEPHEVARQLQTLASAFTNGLPQ